LKKSSIIPIIVIISIIFSVLFSINSISSDSHNSRPHKWVDSDYGNYCKYGIESNFGWHSCISISDWAKYISKSFDSPMSSLGLEEMSINGIKLEFFDKKYNTDFQTPETCSKYESYVLFESASNGYCKRNMIGHDYEIGTRESSTVSFLKSKIIGIEWNGHYSLMLESGKIINFKDKQNVNFGDIITIKETKSITICEMTKIIGLNITSDNHSELYQLYKFGGEINGTWYSGNAYFGDVSSLSRLDNCNASFPELIIYEIIEVEN